MKYYISGLFFLFLSLLSCVNESEPESKQYPLLQTLEVTDINSDGATFNAEFVNLGRNPLIEHGFVFDIEDPVADISPTMILPNDAQKGVESASINEGLAGNLTYYVKAYAKTDNYLIYGNRVEFKSKGSRTNPWNLTLEPSLKGWSEVFTCSYGDHGFLMFQSRDFYSYNFKTNVIKKLTDIPVGGSTGTLYAAFGLGNNLYLFSVSSQSIYKYDLVSNSWSSAGSRPFYPNNLTGIAGFILDNKGYFLSERNLYSYDEQNGTWSKKADMPALYIYSAQTVGSNAYVFAENQEIWSYSSENDQWIFETKYPGKWYGNLYGRIIGFSIQDKIYFGLGYTGGNNNISANDFWEYTPASKSWKKIVDFPLLHQQDGVFSVSSSANGYIGYRNSFYYNEAQADFNLFTYDPKK